MKHLLTEIFNIKKGSYRKKDGQVTKVAYIDPATSENTFDIKDEIKKFGANWIRGINGNYNLQAWGWYLGNNPEWIIKNRIEPCLQYLTSIEQNTENVDRDPIKLIDQLIAELDTNPVITEPDPSSPNNETIEVDTEGVKESLESFKRELINCVSSEDFKAKMEPIIKFKNAQGYSFSLLNSILIYVQDPQATMVKSTTRWRKMNREIKPNSPALVLWCPKKVYFLSKQEKEERTNLFLRSLGKKSVDELTPGEKEILSVRLTPANRSSGTELRANFYDVRYTVQMDGKEDLVGSMNNELPWFDESTEENDKTKALIEAVLSTIQEAGIKVQTVDKIGSGSARGVSKSGSIDYLTSAPKNIGTFNTLVHEFSHELLHQDYLKNTTKNPQGYGQFFIGTAQGRGAVEQQAELSAWLVCRFFGYDMPTNINYVGMWGMNENNAVKVFDEVARVASFIYKKLSEKLNGNSMMESVDRMLVEFTGYDLAKLLGCEDIYLQSKEEEEINEEGINQFKESFDRWTNIFNQHRQLPKFRL